MPEGLFVLKTLTKEKVEMEIEKKRFSLNLFHFYRANLLQAKKIALK